jgi:small subunit ribosomal protein S8
MNTDPIADMLTRIRNAAMVRRNNVTMPASRMKEAVARVLRDEGFILRYETLREGRFPVLKVYLKYGDNKNAVINGVKRVSKPGCRVYTKKDDIPWVKTGLGIVVLSTPRGVLSGQEARRQNVGGELLCEVW